VTCSNNNNPEEPPPILHPGIISISVLPMLKPDSIGAGGKIKAKDVPQVLY